MMKKYYKHIVSLIIAAISLYLFDACSNDAPNDSPFVDNENSSDGPKEATVLIYAIATNSLSGNLVEDKNEILRGAKNIDLNKNNILVFETRYTNAYNSTSGITVNLLKLIRVGTSYEWTVVKEFSGEKPSLNPERISEVISYVTETYQADNYGLIFWSHSTASNPYFPTRTNSEEEIDYPQSYSFGEDGSLRYGDKFYQINVEDLAKSIPDKLFNYIWFDSCYMSNIETIYEFRNKCDFYVGYPTEVCDVGLPYDRVMPFLVGSTPDLKKAGEIFFNYYDNEYYNRIATIAITDMSKIEDFAEYCKSFYSSDFGTPSTSDFLKYTNNRQTSGPFYDLGDYTKAMAAIKGEELSDDEWNQKLMECVVYKAATPTDFNYKTIETEKYSGISTHIYSLDSKTEKELYYQSLDWFKRVFN